MQCLVQAKNTGASWRQLESRTNLMGEEERGDYSRDRQISMAQSYERKYCLRPGTADGPLMTDLHHGEHLNWSDAVSWPGTNAYVYGRILGPS